MTFVGINCLPPQNTYIFHESYDIFLLYKALALFNLAQNEFNIHFFELSK